MNNLGIRRRSGRALPTLFAGLVLLMGEAGTSAACEPRACVASYGPTNEYGPDSCCYIAEGPGHYAAVLNAGGFEIYVDGKITVWGWGEANPVGSFPALAGQTVTIVTQCDRGVYCGAYGAAGVIVAGD